MRGEGILTCRRKHTHIIPMKAGKAGQRPKMISAWNEVVEGSAFSMEVPLKF